MTSTIYHRMLDYSKQFKAPLLNVELEVRMIIPECMSLGHTYETITIPYYRSVSHPTLTIRKINNKIETKEMIKKEVDNNISVIISIEKDYTRFPDSIFPTITRIVKRAVICEQPYTTITYHSNAYFLEVEYNHEHEIEKVMKLVSDYSIPLWPTLKPIDAYSTEIIVRMILDDYYLTPKADGEHTLMYIDKDLNWLCVFDNGKCLGSGSIGSYTIIEGEWMGKYLLGFDVLMYQGEDIRHKDLELRRTYMDIGLDIIIPKSVLPVRITKDLVNAYHTLSKVNYKTDGWILTPKKSGGTIYKSKSHPTVDLQYIDGYLYLANEFQSTREPKDIDHEWENGGIYEFDLEMTMIRKRDDKIIANYKMPVEKDPISNIVNGTGLPCLRFHHNVTKQKLLDLVEGETLLDIGSGYGGDVKKWIKCKFSKIYAVDPDLNLRSTHRNIIHLRCSIQTIPDDISYDIITLFFVPWNNDFLKYFIRAKYVAIIVMTHPHSISTPQATISVDSTQVKIEFPHTVTAEKVVEDRIDIEYVNQFMRDNNYKVNRITNVMRWGIPVEYTIAEMYSYYIYTKE